MYTTSYAIDTDIHCEYNNDNNSVVPVFNTNCPNKKYNDHDNNEYLYKCKNLNKKFKSKRISEGINLDEIDHSMVFAPILYGRIGNYLFPLSLLVIFYSVFKTKYPNTNIKMYTTQHCTNTTDAQAGISNKFNFPTNMESEVFSNIGCRHLELSYDDCNHNYTKQYVDNGLEYNSMLYFHNAEKNRHIFLITINIHEIEYDMNETIDSISPENFELKKIYDDPKSYKIFVISEKILVYKFYLNYKYISLYDGYIRNNLFSNYGQHKNEILRIISTKHNFTVNSFVYVCAHMRFGDYGIGMNSDFTVLYYDYYVKSIEDILHNTQKNIVLIISFHPSDYKLGKFYEKKIKENFKTKEKNDKLTILLEFEIPELNQYINNDILHIYFMSYFDYYIASNSSYSGWSAYFSHNIYIPEYYTIDKGLNFVFSESKNIVKINASKRLIYNYSFRILHEFLIFVKNKYINNLNIKEKIDSIISFFNDVSNEYKNSHNNISIMEIHKILNKFDFFNYDSINEMYNSNLTILTKNYNFELTLSNIEELCNVFIKSNCDIVELNKTSGGKYLKYKTKNKNNNLSF
jgi:hypothetical protein